MAGFMSGFGSGFSSAFERGYAMEKAKQENTFEKMWSTFEKNKSYLDEYKTQDAKDVQAAKSILQQVPGMPPEALGEVYQKVKALGYDDAMKWAANVKLEKTGSLPQQTNAALGDAAKAPQPENTFAPVAPKPAGGGVMDKVKGGLDQLKYFGDKNVYEGQIKRMQEATGLPRKEVESILAMNKGGIPMDQEVAQASTNQFNITPKQQTGTALLDTVPPEKILEYRTKVVNAAQEQGTALQNRRTALKTLLKSTAQNVEMAERNPAIITSVVKSGSKIIAAAKQELNAAIDMTSGKVNKDALPKIMETREGITRRIEELENMNIVDAASQVARDSELFEQRKALDAYSMAALYGQSDRSLSETERELFLKMFDSNIDPVSYSNLMKELISREVTVTDLKAQEIAEKSGLVDYNKQIAASKFADNPTYSVDFNVGSFADEIKGTEYEAAWEFLNKGGNPIGGGSSTQGASTSSPMPEVPTAPTEETLKLFQNVPNANTVLQQAIDFLNSDRTPEAEQEFLQMFKFLPPKPNSNQGQIPYGG